MNKQLERLDEAARAAGGGAGEGDARVARALGAGDLTQRLRTRSQPSPPRSKGKRAEGGRARAGPSGARPAHVDASTAGEAREPARDQARVAPPAAHYRAHFEDAPDAYVVTDAKGVIREANRAAARVLGGRAPRLAGKPLVSFVARADRRAFGDALVALGDPRDPAPIDGLEVRLRARPRGPVSPIDLVARAARGPSGEIDVLRWTARPSRRQSDAERGDAVHAERIDAERRIAELEETTRRQARLIEELVGLGWPETDGSGAPALPVVFDLGALVERAASSLRARLEARGTAVIVDVEPGAHEVVGHPERIAVAIDNLILEALEPEPRPAVETVHVTLDRENDDEVVVTVAGARGTVRSSNRVVARAIALVHGGMLESTDDDGATTHRLILPLHVRAETGALQGAPRAPGVAPPSPGAADLHGLRVLLVEGDATSGEHLLEILQARGAEAVVVTHAAEAVAAVRARPPDVLVSAIQLLDRDGYALIRDVRALGRDRGGAVPAVALTGYASIEEGRKALAAGFQLHVAKPVDDVLFTHAVANVAGAPITEIVV